MSDGMKVLCWHSSRFLGEALSYSFAREHDFDVLDAVTTSDAALYSMQTQALDVLVVGSIPLSTVQQWQTQLSIQDASSIKSLYIGAYPTPQVVQEVMTAGFDAILDGESSHKDAVNFVRSLHNGTEISTSLSSSKILSGHFFDFATACEDINDYKVLEGLSSGRTDREIAEYAGLTFQTTRNRIGRLLHVLEMQNRTQLAIHFLRYRYLIDGERALFEM
jgi:DNA-binding NarL/FixJ family response regulator